MTFRSTQRLSFSIPRGRWFVLDNGMFGLSLGYRAVLFYPDGRLHSEGRVNIADEDWKATAIVDSEQVSADLGRLITLLLARLPTERYEPVEIKRVPYLSQTYLVAPTVSTRKTPDFGDLGLDVPA